MEPPTLSKFVYEPLPCLKTSFRLLAILPRDSNGLIECKLVVGTVVEHQRYDALSYEWGPPSNPDTILVNGHEMEIRHNLHLALQELRRQWSKEGNLYFVDAICINQADIVERNAQVPLMGNIYRNAQRVVAWLGSAQDGSDGLFDLCKTHLTKVHFRKYGNFNIELFRALDNRHDPSYEGLKRGQQKAKLAMEKLFTRSYWTRVWIVQEIVLGKEVFVLCGQKCVPWEAISQLFDCYVALNDYQLSTSNMARHASRQAGGPDLWSQPYYGPLTPMEAVLHVPPIQQVAQMTSQRLRKSVFHDSLADLIQVYDQAGCTLVHDRVYGLIGLASDCTAKKRPTVDYNSTVEQLFYDTLAFCASTAQAVRLSSVLLDALNLRSQLPSIQETALQNKERRLIIGVVPLGTITSKCNTLPVSIGSNEDACDSVVCYDFTRPDASTEERNQIHLLEHGTFIKDHHCITKMDLRTGDKVYWISFTQHALIFRASPKTSGWLNRAMGKRAYVAVARAALVKHGDFTTARTSLGVDLDFMDRCLKSHDQLRSSKASFGLLASIRDVLQLMNTEIPTTEEQFQEAREHVLLQQFLRTR